MADDTILISELSAAESLTKEALLLVSILDQSTESGYGSRKATIEALAAVINGGTVSAIQYAALNTTAKTILGAINELAAGGGGGGTTVEWDQILASGIKIAEITVGGQTTNVYAPAGSGGGYTEVTGTLVAGATSVTLTDPAITANSTIDPYTDTFGVNPTNIAVAAGSVTLTFEAQAADIGVKVRVS